jgi:putative salt-induced outer membrane protein
MDLERDESMTMTRFVKTTPANWQVCALAVLSAGLLSSRVSRADDAPLPDSLVKQDQASSGSTDVPTSGFEKVQKPADDKDATELQLSAGGLASAGNSRSIAATGSGKFRLRRDANQIGAAIAANFARAAAAKETALQTTVENFQGKVRYDRFIAGSFAVFGAASARHDKFQGLDLRLNLDPGIEYYLVDEGKEQLWTEIGYDFQYDIRTDDEIASAAATGDELAKHETRHSGRVFAGYTNNVNKAVTIATGLEYLQGLDNSTNYRLNWDGAVSSSVGKGFSIATTVSVRYDHNPLPAIEKTDVITAVSLVYQLL